MLRDVVLWIRWHRFRRLREQDPQKYAEYVRKRIHAYLARRVATETCRLQYHLSIDCWLPFSDGDISLALEQLASTATVSIRDEFVSDRHHCHLVVLN